MTLIRYSLQESNKIINVVDNQEVFIKNMDSILKFGYDYISYAKPILLRNINSWNGLLKRINDVEGSYKKVINLINSQKNNNLF